MAIITEEAVSGTIYRYHPDENSSVYTAQWIVTHYGEIKGLMCISPTIETVKAFGAWCHQYDGKLKLSTAVESILNTSRRFGFVERFKE
jgi:hypothetical protein